MTGISLVRGGGRWEQSLLSRRRYFQLRAGNRSCAAGALTGTVYLGPEGPPARYGCWACGALASGLPAGLCLCSGGEPAADGSTTVGPTALQNGNPLNGSAKSSPRSRIRLGWSVCCSGQAHFGG